MTDATPTDPSIEADDGPPQPTSDAERLLLRVRELIAGARPMPLSASAMINKDEILVILDDAMRQLPEELRQARWLLKERDEYLSKVQAEGDDLLASARSQAERMVQRTEVAQEAKRVARRTVTEAEEQARRMIHEAEDYIDQKLASFEIILDRTLKTVQAGRERLQATAPAPEDDEPIEALEGPHPFDQDTGPFDAEGPAADPAS